MNQITSLILPSTIADETAIRQLLLFSDTVCQLAPAEDTVKAATTAAFAGHYVHYPPAPLADKLPLFQKFIKDVTTNRTEYYGGALSHLSSAMVTDVDESAVWQLINTLTQKSSVENKQAETIMHARLLLKLAEVHTTEGEEIQAALASIDTKANQLMATLKDDEEDDDHDETLGDLFPTPQPPPKGTSPQQILKAWFQLFLADKTMTPPTLLATDEETYTTLNEYASTLLAPQANRLCRLSIPKEWFSAPLPEFLKLRTRLHHDSSATIKRFQQAITQAKESTTPLSLKDEAETLTLALQELTGNTNPEHAINLYTLPISLSQLACRLTNTTSPISVQHQTENTIIAVC